jgi:uncharacterized protein (TIGR03083 family)
METSPEPWITALRNSHDRLRDLAGPLDPDQLEQGSYDTEWTIAQVLSHLGSQAEIFGMFLNAGLSGEDPPGREEFIPIWEVWNAKSPQAQAADALAADEATLQRFESLDASQRAALKLRAFGLELDLAGVSRMRLGEHAIHTWDIAVVLDQDATVAPDAVGLLIDTIAPLAARTGKPDGRPRRLRVVTSDPERQFVLETGDAVSLTEGGGEAGLAELRLPAEALVRLVYGRLDADHTPVAAESAELDELRGLFPGF